MVFKFGGASEFTEICRVNKKAAKNLLLEGDFSAAFTNLYNFEQFKNDEFVSAVKGRLRKSPDGFFSKLRPHQYVAHLNSVMYENARFHAGKNLKSRALVSPEERCLTIGLLFMLLTRDEPTGWFADTIQKNKMQYETFSIDGDSKSISEFLKFIRSADHKQFVDNLYLTLSKEVVVDNQERLDLGAAYRILATQLQTYKEAKVASKDQQNLAAKTELLKTENVLSKVQPNFAARFRLIITAVLTWLKDLIVKLKGMLGSEKVQEQSHQSATQNVAVSNSPANQHVSSSYVLPAVETKPAETKTVKERQNTTDNARGCAEPAGHPAPSPRGM